MRKVDLNRKKRGKTDTQAKINRKIAKISKAIVK